MHQPLNPNERRVFGALLEKSLAQPSYYPMTLNAIVSACNQKSNRDPLMKLDEDSVWDALETLRERGLVSRVLASMTGRVDRFRHEAKTALGWEKPQRAVMAELLLRGPQTVGELRSRCTRMFPFDNTQALSAVIEGLSSPGSAMIAPLPRAPGRAATRYAHLLYPDDEQPVPTQTTPPAAPAEPPTAAAGQPAKAEHSNRQLEEMQAEIAELHETVAELRRRLEAIEQRRN